MNVGKQSKKLLSLVISLVMVLSATGSVWPAFAQESAGASGISQQPESNAAAPDESEPVKVKTETSAAPRAAGDDDRLTKDEAYISKAICTAVYDGMEPFDADDAPGNDSVDNNRIIRTFDVASYKLDITNTGRDNVQYKTGMLYYEFVLPVPADDAQFEIGSMGWVTQRKEAWHEIVYTTDKGGNPIQVLRGHFLWEPSADNPSAIGAGQQDLSVFIRVLTMYNGQTLKPDFTFWLEGNQVPADGLVTGSGYQCPTHGEEEYKTVENVPELRISAAPRFDVRIKDTRTQYYYADKFDFSTGNDLAPNKDAGVVDGRISVFGISVSLAGSEAKGIRGCELPKKGEPITLQVKVSSTVEGTSKAGATPLLWSVDNNNPTGDDHLNVIDRRMVLSGNGFARYGAPYAYFNEGRRIYACYNSGKWTGTQTDDTISITLSGFQVDLTKIPFTDAGNTKDMQVYYDPSCIIWNNPATRDTMVGVRFWDAWRACFAAGELWVVQPFADSEGNPVQAGNFSLKVEEGNLELTTESGAKLEKPADGEPMAGNQVIQNNDTRYVTLDRSMIGGLHQWIAYMESKDDYNFTDSMTAGCHENGQDWCVPGQEFAIQDYLGVGLSEGDARVSAADQLIKWDDAFMEPTGKVRSAFIYGLYTDTTNGPLWAAKKDKTGWNHNGLKPDEPGYDNEMQQAKIDDLVYYQSLDALKADGAVCVGILFEWRGLVLNKTDSETTMVYVYAKVKDDSSLQGNVYALAHCARVWRVGETKAWARANGADPDAMSENDFITYICDNFPAYRLGTGGAYPQPKWYSEKDQSGVFSYTKAQYLPDGSIYDPDAGRAFGDSARVVSCYTTIGKQVAQIGSDNKPKTIYDLDTNQTVADFVLNPTVHGSSAVGMGTADGTLTTTVTVEDVLPPHLHYITGSAYAGGVYTQNGQGKQGTVTGGVQAEPAITIKDGKEILRWTFTDVEVTGNEVTALPPIYYSCQIAAFAGEEELKDNEELPNTATIWCTQDINRPFTSENGNTVTRGIKLSRNASRSLSKQADSRVVNPGEGMGFTLNVGNNSATTVSIFAVDSLPYAGDGYSDITGDIFLTEFKALTLLNELQDGTLKLYYTNDEAQRGKRSINYAGVLDDTIWTQLTVNADGTADLPANCKPVALAAVGTLPGNQTLKIHLTLTAPQSKSGEYVVNWLSCDSLESSARTDVAACSIEGVAWRDTDKDGVRADEEMRINGITAQLLVLKEGGDAALLSDYTPYVGEAGAVKTATGKKIDANSGEQTDYSEGAYRFDNLPFGVYAVRFADGTVKITDFTLTEPNEGADDTVDSDAVGEYVGTELTAAHITAIDLTTEEAKAAQHYVSAHHDAGFIGVLVSLEISKTVTGKDGDTSKAFTFTVQFTNADGTPYTENIAYNGKAIEGVDAPADGALTPDKNGKAEFALRHGQSVVLEGLPIHTAYTVTEAEANKGGYKTSTNGSASCKDMQGNMAVEFINARVKTTVTPPPKTDDEGHFGLWIGLMAAAAAIGIVLVALDFFRKKRDNKNNERK